MPSTKNVYNILLLGETGTGKSLFINSFANYNCFNNLTEAIKSKKPVNLIPSKFKVTDVNDKDHFFTFGENDENERTEVTESMTVSCRSYKFQSGNLSVRLIDTPGVGDTKGEEADNSNVANVLNYINNFDNLHAIGILMKNTETKMTDRFIVCLTTLLANLHNSAVNNIVFILTFSSGNGFKPGPVTDVIKTFNEKELKNSPLKLDKDRMYCLDNRSYMFLIGTQNGVQFDKDEFDSQVSNWRRSSNEMTRLLKYVRNLTPHEVKDTVSLNNARQFINITQEFLLEVLKNIDDNAKLINDYENGTVGSIKQKDIKIVEIHPPITYCKSQKCRQTIKIGGNEKYHYPKHCCKGCRVNSKLRWWCDAIDWEGYCKVCECHKDFHQRRFYKTEIISTNLFTPEGEKIMKSLTDRKAQLMHEKSVIEDAEKKFAKFFQEHSLTKSPKEEYKVIEKYEKEIAQMKSMNTDEIHQLKNTLLNLPIYGGKMKAVLNADAKGLTASIVANEIVNEMGTTFKSCFSQ